MKNLPIVRFFREIQKRGCAPIKLKKRLVDIISSPDSNLYCVLFFRKSKIKLEGGLDDEPEFKVKKESPSTSSTSICLDHEYLSAKSTSDIPPNEENFRQSPTNSIKKEEDIWFSLEDAGEIKDLLPAGIIKNSSKLRFDVKEISLAEEV